MTERGGIPPGYRYGQRIVLVAIVTVVLGLFTVAGAAGVPSRLSSTWLGVTRGVWSWTADLFT
jgi:hypothetical protein